MFYTYGLTADTPGANNFTYSPSAISGETAAASARKGAQSLGVVALSPQIVVPTLTTGAIRNLTEANIATLARLKFHPSFFSPAAATTQSARAVVAHLAAFVAAVSTTQSWLLTFPRISHSILAAKSPYMAAEVRGLFLAFRTSHGMAPRVLKIISRAASITATTAAALQNQIGKLHLSAHDASVVAFLGLPVRLAAVSPTLLSKSLSVGKLISAATVETIALGRAMSRLLSAPTAQLAHLLTSSRPIVLARVLSPQVTALLRAIATTISGAVSSNITHIFRAPVRLAPTASTAASGLVKAAGKLLGGASPTSIATSRAPGLVRRTTEGMVAILAAAAQRPLSVAATMAQVAADFIVRAVRLLVASAQVTTVRRGTARFSGLVFATVVTSVRGISRAASVISAEVVVLIAPGLHFVTAVVTATQSLLVVRSHNLFRGLAATLLTVATQVQTGRRATILALVLQPLVVALQRATSKQLGVTSAQQPVAGHVDFKIIATSQRNVATVAVPKAVRLGTALALKARVVSWFHLFVPDLAYQQTTLLPPGGVPAEPPSFGAIDPSDQTTFAFDWSARAAFNDPIISATVVSIPKGMTFLGPVFTGGTLVEVTALPFTPPKIPATYSLRCTCVFASGRRSSFSIPVPIRRL
jgi:hypothetical protein